MKANYQPAQPHLPNYYTTNREYLQLNTAILQSSQAYQRPVDPKHVQAIVDNFNPLYCSEILVSFRDGQYFVIDGQNRIAAFRRMNNGKDCMADCKVFYGLTYEDEADFFAHLDQIKKNMRFCDIIKSKSESKRDRSIITITQILNRCGLKWEFKSGGGGNAHKTIKASKALMDCFDDLGPILFETAMRLLIKTWRGDKDSMSAPFIKGVCCFVKVYAQEADEKTFVKKLSSKEPEIIRALSKSQPSGITDAAKYARIFYDFYTYRNPGLIAKI